MSSGLTGTASNTDAAGDPSPSVERDSASNRDYFPSLTGFRALAAILVYMSHFNPWHELTARGWPFRLTLEMHTGLIMFYVLSGFLIHYRYGSRNPVRRVGTWVEYALSRVGRIVPIYYLILGLTYLVDGVPGPNSLLVQLSLLQGYFPVLALGGIPQSWTLTIEETFYFLAPILFLYLQRVSLLALGAVCLTFAIGFALRSEDITVVFHGFFGAMPSFIAGIWLSQWYQAHGAPRRSSWLTYASFALLALIHLGLALCRPTDGPRHIVTEILFALQLVLILPIIVAFFLRGMLTERSLIRTILGFAPIVVLGQSSYVFYLIHFGVIKSFLDEVLGFPYVAKLLIVTALAIFFCYGFERPMTKFCKYLGRKLGSRGQRGAILWDELGRAALSATLTFAVAFAIWQSSLQTKLYSWSLSRRANLAHKQLQDDVAEAYYIEALDAWPENKEALITLGRMRQRSGDFESGNKLLLKAVKNYPESGTAHFFLAEGFDRLGLLDRAKLEYIEAVDIGQHTRESLVRLGFIYRTQREWDNAEDAFRRTLAAFPVSANAAVGLADVLMHEGRFDEAAKVVDDVVRHRPDAPELLELQAELSRRRSPR